MKGQLQTHVTVIIAALQFLISFSGTGMAFPIPERLEFEVSYVGIPVGRAVHQVSRSGNEVVILSTARSADWLKHFFPVDDRIESVLGPATPPHLYGATRLYREKINEGKTHRWREAIFDRNGQSVTTRDFIKKTMETRQVTSRTHDMLSGFFHVRMIPLQAETSVYIDIFDCKRLWNTEVQVLRREEIEVPVGRFRTIVIKPVLKSEGIFSRTGDMFIWLSDDERRIPVQMKSRMRVGGVTATLVGGSYWPEKK